MTRSASSRTDRINTVIRQVIRSNKSIRTSVDTVIVDHLGAVPSDTDSNTVLREQSTPSTRQRPISDKSKKARDALWDSWTSFFRDVAQEDPEQVWLDLCQEKPNAEKLCQRYLEYYLLKSEASCLALGPEECETRLTISTAHTISEVWKALVTHADDKILYRKRQEDPQNKLKWMLRHLEKDAKGLFPASRISQWIANELADSYGLSREQSFIKREATTDDILKMLDAIWANARDIPCSPKTRVSFAWVVILGGLCGFRPEVLMNMTYRQIQMAMVRDPSNTETAIPVATINVEHNKQKTNAIRRSQNEKFSFSITPVPCQLICLVSLIIGRALCDNAFEAGYQAYEDVIRRPALEDVDYVPLRWKVEFLDQPIFPINYHAFWKIWQNVQLVIGLRDILRPYALRVGAGLRLNGVLEPSLRNYVLSNSSQVYEKNYLPRQFTQNLMKLAYGTLAGEDDITPLVRRAILKRDEKAPLRPTQKDYESFENREDIQELRAQLEKEIQTHGRKSKEAKRVRNQLRIDIAALSKLTVTKNRKDYFEAADRLRSLGLSTAALRESVVTERPKSRRFSRSACVAERIGKLIRQGDGKSDRQGLFVDMLMAFIRAQPRDGITDEDGPHLDDNDPKLPRCLLCGLRCAHRSSLTRHVKTVHEKAGTFKAPFPCPECASSNKPIFMVTGGSHWSNHVARHHGKENAPNLPSEPGTATGPARCLICNGIFSAATNLRKHVRNFHAKLKLFDKPMSCPECQRLGQNESIINGLAAWRDHVRLYHLGVPAPPLQTKEICLLCNKTCQSGAPFMKHFKTIHIEKEGLFAPNSTFDCTACLRSAGLQINIQNQSDWYCHVAKYHSTQTQDADKMGHNNGIGIQLVDPARNNCVIGQKHARADEETPLDDTHLKKKRWKGPDEVPTSVSDVAASGDDAMVIDPRLFEL
ncbi:hypothetical protein LZ30DRAFT_687313 [Colletotrichum cereale]|nr:hypothetical protein LZ30DRAFT_687313 [Colletotrichum cereale]